MGALFKNAPNRRTINHNNNRRQNRRRQGRPIQDHRRPEHKNHIIPENTEKNWDNNIQSISYLDILRQRFPEYYN